MTTQSDTDTITLSCSVCHMTVCQAKGTRRTICPNCGNFYDTGPAAGRLLGQRPRARDTNEIQPNVENEREKEKPAGRLNALSNLFKRNKDPRNKDVSSGRKGSTKSGEGSQLPPLAVNNNRNLLSVNSVQSVSRSSSRSSNRPQSGRSVQTPRSVESKPAVPHKTVAELTAQVQNASLSGNWTAIQDYYSYVFLSFTSINYAFKKDHSKEYKSTDDPGIKSDFVNCVFDNLLIVPQDIQKVVLKSIINSLLKDKRPITKDDLRAFLILVQNPQFNNVTTYVIFAHLLRQIASLTDHDHHYLVHWFKRLEGRRVKDLIHKLINFVSCRLFPPKPQDLPPMTKCSWWIPSATKVLALLNAANNMSSPALVNFTEFYNQTLDHLDLMAEYYTWQNPSAHPGFSFCQYPFILSIAAKRNILQRDSEQQMIVMARRSLVAKVQRRQLPDIGMLFLNLNVRRSNLVSDSLNEIARKQHDLKKKLKVNFLGEAGLDMGGLTKEWFLLLIRQIFQEEYGMFTYDRTARVFWFNSSQCESYQEFNLVGVLMGLAVYNSIILDIHFPPVCYKKLLSPAVVPYNNPHAGVGVTTATVQDLQQTKPELAQGLTELLQYEGDVEEDFGLTFQISFTEFGSLKTHTLRENGENIPVTNKNRKEYVGLYVDYLLNRCIYNQFQAFYHGFHSVCASNALIMLRPEEVEMLVCGSPSLNLAELRKVTVYDGFTAQDVTIRLFWDVVLNLSKDLQKRLLLFTTGSDRIPIGGMSEMQFKITKVNNLNMLPMAHTCFNQLVLPAYTSKKMLKQKLLIAIQNAEGFGIE